MSSEDDMPDLVGCESTGSESSSESDDEPSPPPTPTVVVDNVPSDDDDLPLLISDSGSSSDDTSSDDSFSILEEIPTSSSSTTTNSSSSSSTTTNNNNNGNAASADESDDSLPELVSDCSSSDSDSDSSDSDGQILKAKQKAKKQKAAKAKAAKAKAAKAKAAKAKAAKAKTKKNKSGGQKKKSGESKSAPFVPGTNETPREKRKRLMKKIRGRINGELGWCSRINKLELETAEYEEETYVFEQDCKRVERNIELVENVSKQMKVEDGCVLDKDIKELQWLYSKHDRLQIMLAHLKSSRFFCRFAARSDAKIRAFLKVNCLPPYNERQ